ncbi:Fucose 4-O-acetylase [Xylanibacter ruminicola]|uniref:Fucose 4-O-acetylase n=1 Tax=Xylanibacter ruminicola TaxID=839 RepID=A0A1M7EJ03_XYLRU|nr:acyltransferase family protein [Xylanibacter ruminicola]SHL91688.1 Fucose 4-O-acetylase [Xylanibacter ruminicola]
MEKLVHNNSIAIAKAIGIFFMVVGHSGCPQSIFRFIYLFHMPLFFFCSGIFFKEMSSIVSVGTYLKKRIKGLYIPFVKWAVFFLILHNMFMKVGLYNAYYGFEGGTAFYTISDIFQRLCKILFIMNGYEELLGGFWFIRSLFVSCLLIAVFSLIFRRRFKYKYWLLCLLFLVLTVLIRRISPDIEFWREISMGCLGAMFYILGYLLMPYFRLWQNWYSALLLCFSLLFFFYYFKNGISMGCGYNKVVPFSLSAISGSLLTICISKQIDNRNSLLKYVLYYIGNHTLVILALHFLAFRFVSYIISVIYGVGIIHVAEHPVIKDVSILPNYWWTIYCVAGIAIPLLLNRFWQVITILIRKKNE